MGGDGGVIAAKREYMQSCGDVFGMKGGMAKTALNRTETAELRTKVSRKVTVWYTRRAEGEEVERRELYVQVGVVIQRHGQ